MNCSSSEILVRVPFYSSDHSSVSHSYFRPTSVEGRMAATMSRPDRRGSQNSGPDLRDFMHTYRYLLIYIAVITTVQIVLMLTYHRL